MRSLRVIPNLSNLARHVAESAFPHARRRPRRERRRESGSFVFIVPWTADVRRLERGGLGGFGGLGDTERFADRSKSSREVRATAEARAAEIRDEDGVRDEREYPHGDELVGRERVEEGVGDVDLRRGHGGVGAEREGDGGEAGRGGRGTRRDGGKGRPRWWRSRRGATSVEGSVDATVDGSVEEARGERVGHGRDVDVDAIERIERVILGRRDVGEVGAPSDAENDLHPASRPRCDAKEYRVGGSGVSVATQTAARRVRSSRASAPSGRDEHPDVGIRGRRGDDRRRAEDRY